MAKRVFIICCLLFNMATICFAQQTSIVNPFSKLSFLKGPTDTITLIANYSGINQDIVPNNNATIESIKKQTGKVIKGLNYSIDLKLDNYPLLSVACNDKSAFNALTANVGKNTKLSIKCIVYRFYFFDGICNFFYINKVNLF